jgi:hypothetical protein
MTNDNVESYLRFVFAFAFSVEYAFYDFAVRVGELRKKCRSWGLMGEEEEIGGKEVRA